MPTKRSRVHPKYKTAYRVANWPNYDRALVDRGDITLWLSPAAIAEWKAAPTGRRSAQPKFSDLAIETVLTIRLVLGLPLRRAEGFVRSLFLLMNIPLEDPDHTTLARRARSLDVAGPRKPSSPVHLVIDSTGLSFHGEGEWAAAKHGRETVRGWRKLHLAVADSVILAHELTESAETDAVIGSRLSASSPEATCSAAGSGSGLQSPQSIHGTRATEVGGHQKGESGFSNGTGALRGFMHQRPWRFRNMQLGH